MNSQGCAINFEKKNVRPRWGSRNSLRKVSFHPPSFSFNTRNFFRSKDFHESITWRSVWHCTFTSCQTAHHTLGVLNPIHISVSVVYVTELTEGSNNCRFMGMEVILGICILLAIPKRFLLVSLDYWSFCRYWTRQKISPWMSWQFSSKVCHLLKNDLGQVLGQLVKLCRKRFPIGFVLKLTIN